MLILPESWPDESIYSLLAKIARLNGLSSREVIGLLTGEEHPISVIGCPMNIKHFCEATEGAYGSPNDLLSHSTVFSALAQLGALSASTLSQVANGATRPELGMLAFGMARGRHWRLCRDCVERDVKIYGISYWHRVHQLPTSQYCTEHGLILDRLDLHHVQLRENLVLPHDVSNKAEPSNLPAAQESSCICLDVSILGRDALADNSEPFSKEVIQATYMAGLAQMGLLTGTGKILLTEYFDEFRQKFGVETSITILLRQSKVSNPKQLLYGITNEFECRPFARLLLVKLLFGTWEAFKEQCVWQDVLDEGAKIMGTTNSQVRMGLLSFEAMLQQQRQVCLDYKTSHIPPTRHEFMKVSNRAFRWLRHNDRTWLDEEPGVNGN
jgi:hypothetical protein